MRLGMISVGVLAMLWAAPASAHGCHQAWQQSAEQGWHSHGAKCDVRKGIGVSKRDRSRTRRSV